MCTNGAGGAGGSRNRTAISKNYAVPIWKKIWRWFELSRACDWWCAEPVLAVYGHCQPMRDVIAPKIPFLKSYSIWLFPASGRITMEIECLIYDLADLREELACPFSW